MSALTPLGQDQFETTVSQATRPVLVEFGAAWCGPCKMLEPVLVELAGEYGDRVDFYTVDVDQAPQLAMNLGVMSVPTVILFREGQAAERISGYRPRRALEKTFLSDL